MAPPLDHQALKHLQDRLSSIYPCNMGHLNLPYVRFWCRPEILALLLRGGITLAPETIEYIKGKPHNCHQEALLLAGRSPTTVPFFGFALCAESDGFLWWIHSWAMRGDTLFDPAPRCPLPRYFGIPWCPPLRLIYQEAMSSPKFPWLLEPEAPCTVSA